MTTAIESARRGRPALCYTPEEMARFYVVSQKTIYRWAEIGELPCLKKGHTVRFPKSLIDPILRKEGLLQAA